MAGRGRVQVWGGPLVALSSAVGALVGLRSVVALELPGFRGLLGLPTLPRETLGISWSGRALWPAQIQGAALERLTGLVAALFLAAAGVALLNTLILLFEAGASRRREIAVRAAVGEGPWPVVRRLVSDVRRLVASGLVLGLLLGLAWGGALRGAWPGVVAEVGWLGAAASLVPPVGLVAVLTGLAYVWTGVSVARGGALARALLSGERATAAPGEAFQRRILAALQSGVAGAVALGALGLSLGVGTPPSGGSGEGPTTVVATVTAPAVPGDGWRELRARLAALPGLEAETLATPGALVGLGIRDYATAQCGNCYRGGLPLPFWGAVVDHHAVGPDYFRLAGMTLGAGRGFTDADGPGAARVAVVNRTFANTAFEKGEPLGRKVRLGSDLDAWYEVVGIVEDMPMVGVGGDDLARAAVYVSALQHPPRTGSLLLSGSDDAVAAALDVAASVGFGTAAPRTVQQLRRDAQATVRWLGRLAFVLALLTLALAVHGGHATALQVARRRVRELAVRRALGATDGRIVRHVLAGAAGTALGGSAIAVFFGALLVAWFRKVAGGVPAPDAATYVAVVVILVGVGLAASARAAG
ncbi:MAG TPA: ABC transporter permease, partial [Longimicrobiales bacterium]|nr:ABC transporter permease [Longimicrobiales bacterium]